MTAAFGSAGIGRDARGAIGITVEVPASVDVRAACDHRELISVVPGGRPGHWHEGGGRWLWTIRTYLSGGGSRGCTCWDCRPCNFM